MPELWRPARELATMAGGPFDADHPDTLATRANLATFRGEAGDPSGAAAAFEELLADNLRVLGADHPHTMTTRSNIAALRGETGDPAGAAAAFEELLADCLRVFGPRPPSYHGHPNKSPPAVSVGRVEAE